MIKVLVDGVIYGAQEYGGISRYFRETLARIGDRSEGLEILLHLPARCRSRVPQGRGVRQITDLPIGPLRAFSPLTRAVSKARAWARRPQVFHSTYYTMPYWSGLRSVVTVHDFTHEKYPALLDNAYKFIEQKRRAIETADALIAVSERTREEMLTYCNVDPAKIHVIHHGLGDGFIAAGPSGAELEQFRKEYNVGEHYWLYVGKRGSYKNFGTFFRSFAKVADETNGDLVAVGGEPSLEAWQIDMLIRNRLEQKVHLLHGIDDKTLVLAYAGAAGFVFPSLAEGFGIPLLEAMACGAPIVASDIAVFREVCGDAALYFEPHDECALAQVMLRVLDEETRRGLVLRGRSRVEGFSWGLAAQKLASVYRSVV